MKALLDQRVRLNPIARLRVDPVTNGTILLSPERGMRLNASASLVLERCSGQFTVREIANDIFNSPCLQPDPATSLDRVTEDVMELVEALRLLRLLEFGQNP